MNKFALPALLTVLFATTAHAADPKAAAAATVVRALSCEERGSKPRTVVKALKTLGARPGRLEGDFVLPSPIAVFGLPVTHVTVSESDGATPDAYLATFPGGNMSEVAAAARLKPDAGDSIVRAGKAGRLEAAIRDTNNVVLSCMPL